MHHRAKFYQNQSKGCRDDVTIFKMAAVRHLGFLKFSFLTVGAVKRPILHQRNKFRKNKIS